MEKLYFCLRSIKDCKKIHLIDSEIIINHCRQYSNEEQFTTSLLAYTLLDQLLKKENKSINEISFSKNGKPLFKEAYVSISHSKDFILVSYSEVKHGVDVQVKDNNINEEKIMKRYFPSRYNEYTSLDKEKRSDLFYSLWVNKEAYIKTYDLNILDFKEKEIDCYSSTIEENGDKYYYSIYSGEDVEIIRI